MYIGSLIRFISRYKNLVRSYSKSISASKDEIAKIRNIGILAHIDAGKTTTTERMLFYAGSIKQMGEVHDGNTVTDFMSQERERGITIRSAAVTFLWRKHQVNVIDTPGHIDFTMEVEQTLNVLDGTVIVLDASAGVEAQTVTVWQQADRYRIPKLVFVNKMDRADADLEMCCKSIEKKMGASTLCLQLPYLENSKFTGIIDILTMEKLKWTFGKSAKETITKESDTELFNRVIKLRAELVDTIAFYDDDLAKLVIEKETVDDIPTTIIVNALRRVVATEKVIPVLCGSAYKNIGIEPLLDAIILYLPSPIDTKHHFQHFGDHLCARAFKIVHDKQRGAVTFFRIYSGNFTKGQKIYNVQKNSSEQAGKLMVPFADEYKEIESLGCGHIAAVTGLKLSTSGDMVTNSANSAASARKSMLSKYDNDVVDSLFSRTPKIPEAVFFCCIEPPSLSQQAAMENALAELQREDPSLRVTHDTDTGQVVLGGMGELHLEIVRDRLLKEYKVDARLGRLQISYREAPLDKASCDITTEMKLGNTKHFVSISLSLIPGKDVEEKGNLILDRTPDSASNISSLLPRQLAAVKQGIQVAFTHGPKIGYQVINAQVMLHTLNTMKGTTEFAIEATTTQCVQKLLKQAGSCVLEPIMHLEILCLEDYVSAILADLSRKRAGIRNITVRGNNKIIICDVPLAELLGYSTTLRTISSGTASFTMEFLEYKKMSSLEEAKAIEYIRGF